jgi:hypothetical protein
LNDGAKVRKKNENAALAVIFLPTIGISPFKIGKIICVDGKIFLSLQREKENNVSPLKL